MTSQENSDYGTILAKFRHLQEIISLLPTMTSEIPTTTSDKHGMTNTTQEHSMSHFHLISPQLFKKHKKQKVGHSHDDVK